MSIIKDTENEAVYVVSLDQLQSSQLGLVPQLSGKFTSASIWDAQVIVDDFSDLIYVHIMISTSQEVNFALKSAF